MRTWAPLCCPMLPSKWHVHSMFWSGATSPALSFSLLAHISKKIWREETDWHSDPLLSIPGHSTLFVGRVCCSRWKLRSKNNFFCHDLFPSSLYSLKRRCEKPPKILRHRSAWERQFNDTIQKNAVFTLLTTEGWHCPRTLYSADRLLPVWLVSRPDAVG